MKSSSIYRWKKWSRPELNIDATRYPESGGKILFEKDSGVSNEEIYLQDEFRSNVSTSPQELVLYNLIQLTVIFIFEDCYMTIFIVSISFFNAI